MATNLVFSDIESLREIWPVAAEVASGVALLSATGNRAGVSLTASGGHTTSKVSGPYTISGIPDGGVGLDALQVSVATTGTWEFAVTGGLTTTPQNALVYITSGGVLTLTSTSNTLWGRVNYPKGYEKVAGTLPVKIGA